MPGFLSNCISHGTESAAQHANGYSSEGWILLWVLEKSLIDNTEMRKRFTCFHNISIKSGSHNMIV